MSSPSRFDVVQSAFSPRHPVKSLSIAFALWKALIFLVVVTCPGPGYDTSTSLLPYQAEGLSDVISSTHKHRIRSSYLALPLRFVRWDSIYYVHAAEHGYVFEQEWAFGYGYTRIIALLLSVLVLYKLSIHIFGSHSPKQRFLCLLSAALHIISPAGAFLSAPYGEALFSLLNISGFYLYSSSVLDGGANKRVSRDLKLLAAATLFFAATTVRSNGIFGGILFAFDAVQQLWKIVCGGLSWHAIRRLGVIVVGGCVVGLGMIVPQVIAYREYCMVAHVSRPWCEWIIPSIYGWVQEQYWNVGFLRYWTVPNIPLFLLAMPMLALLLWSSLWGLRLSSVVRKDSNDVAPTMTTATVTSLLTRLSVVQGVLAVLALTSYHVQIINRISSGYPLWYWYLAAQLVGDATDSSATSKRNRLPAVLMQTMMIYGLIQAILFGSFLPPA
ncbi:DUF409 domain protein [Aspergillus clavatus NRRL 1]|uniref:GPI mannosyltransferase 2 n=1 Tax=Aspergillus clavatus (strain ATCC 1007 / CBS 513.65 / DSM 816 / NCTC 3887 / NRRL 1 / QM 1276 / 107) TaxID=344612 RepID=A1CI60_ASPCL|nr:DUF409 domain protein [Aspergillus clavatus NRRL 1]EAW10565.1 DUF409 domain protein [Aspergillus clavatus NRRL 1]